MREQVRSIKIGENEKGGWTSDRPSPSKDTRGKKPRPPRRIRPVQVLEPRTAYVFQEGDLLVVAGPAEIAQPVLNVVEAPCMSLTQIKDRLSKADADRAKVDEVASSLLAHYITSRLEAGKTTVVFTDDFSQDNIAELAVAAGKAKKSTHLLVLEAGRKLVDDEKQFSSLSALVKASRGGEVGSLGVRSVGVLGRNESRNMRAVTFHPDGLAGHVRSRR